MNISARSLFHYTVSADVVKLILRNGLRFSRLEEELPLGGYKSNIFDQIPGLVKHMQFGEGVCLCDLPLSLTKDHRKQYGQFALGFSKEWGMGSGASPVRYVHRMSPDIGLEFFNTILDSPDHIAEGGSVYAFVAWGLDAESPDFDKMTSEQKKVFVGVDQFCRGLLDFCALSASFLRVHDGDWEDRVSGNVTHRRFYDEREWRIVRSPNNNDHVQFTEADLAHVLVSTDAERSEIIEYAISDCPNLKIRNRDDFARKVRTFSETFDEA